MVGGEPGGGAARPAAGRPDDNHPTSAAQGDPGASPTKPAPAAVFWHDKPPPSNQGTFFDDLTPPPSPLPPSHGRGSLSVSLGYPPSSSRDGQPVKNEGYDHRYDRVAPPAPIPTAAPRVCGLRRRLFWTIVAVVAVAILGLAIGLGVGLSTGDGDSSTDKQRQQQQDDGSSAPSSSTSPTSTSTASGESGPQATVDIGTSKACPYANNTAYRIPNSGKIFLRLCGVDYAPAGGTQDLATIWTASVEDCMVNCAGYTGCVGCSWGPLPGDDYRDNHRCFLKKSLGEPHDVRDGWDFAILQ